MGIYILRLVISGGTSTPDKTQIAESCKLEEEKKLRALRENDPKNTSIIQFLALASYDITNGNGSIGELFLKLV